VTFALLPGEREAGLSGQTPRQLTNGNAGGFHHVRCAAVNNRPRNNGSACFSRELITPRAKKGAPAGRRHKTQQDLAQRAKHQGEIAKAQRQAFTGQK
jgi:hypothetical protein